MLASVIGCGLTTCITGSIFGNAFEMDAADSTKQVGAKKRFLLLGLHALFIACVAPLFIATPASLAVLNVSLLYGAAIGIVGYISASLIAASNGKFVQNSVERDTVTDVLTVTSLIAWSFFSASFYSCMALSALTLHLYDVSHAAP